MVICWDNLEGMYLTNKGIFLKGTNVYIYREDCACCGHSYLTPKIYNSSFCSRSCAQTGDNNHRFGKGLCGKDNPMYKGDTMKLQRPLYDTYAHRLKFCESCKRSIDNKLFMDVKCAYCGKWFSCSRSQVVDRVRFIEGKKKFEAHFYCSDGCREACPIFNQKMYPKGFKHTTSREVSPYLRKMVLERDNWTCQICGKTIAECQLHCHHMDPVSWNPMFQNDIDSCITLCKGCHKMVHSRKGCRYVDLICRNGQES